MIVSAMKSPRSHPSPAHKRTRRKTEVINSPGEMPGHFRKFFSQRDRARGGAAVRFLPGSFTGGCYVYWTVREAR